MTPEGVQNSIYAYNGIDRKNANDDYTEENCVPCCSVCNFAKGVMSYDDFFYWIEQVNENSQKMMSIDVSVDINAGSVSIYPLWNKRIKPQAIREENG